MAGALTMAGGIATGASALVRTPDSASATPAAAPGAPTGLTATAGNGRVTLSWTAPASDGGSPVTGYDVYTAASADFDGAAKVGPVTGTAAVLTDLADGTPYYFRVTAVNAAGQSPFSAQVSAEPARPASGVTASLTSPATRRQLIIVLTAIAAVAAAGAVPLIARRRRRLRPRDPDRPARDPARSGQQMAVPPDVRAVPDTVLPDVLSVRDTGREPSHTIRVEADPGVITMTIKERQP